MFTESHESFIFNSSIGIHAISPEGIILYANLFELDMLGYQEHEYVGHHVSEFQLDAEHLDDMLTRLENSQCLKNYPARVKAKHGIKYLLYNSSAYLRGGVFEHTRCYANEIDREIYDIYTKRSGYLNQSI